VLLTGIDLDTRRSALRLARDPACWAERRPSLLYWSTCLRVIFGRVFQRSTLRSFTTRSPESSLSFLVVEETRDLHRVSVPVLKIIAVNYCSLIM